MRLGGRQTAEDLYRRTRKLADDLYDLSKHLRAEGRESCHSAKDASDYAYSALADLESVLEDFGLSAKKILKL
ncbi:MAG: hypothetical protein OXD30_00660 [Bryobacterales bacterium]|nr:hypothetical protein [Bryobacterales bacterium]